MLAIEAGINWRLQRVLLYTGLYVDYGFNTIVEKSDRLIATYNSDPASRHASMLNARYKLADEGVENVTENVIPVAIGFKVGVTFGHGRKKEKYGDYDHPPVFKDVWK
jgi:hypothetical protein